ncbi:unnamed protein product [Cunninghamella blakesleeana]
MSNLFSWLKTTISSSSSSSTSIHHQCNQNDNSNKDEDNEDNEIIGDKMTTLSLNSTISSSCSSFDQIEEMIDHFNDDKKASTTLLKKVYYHDKNAKQVFLTGDFDQWKGTIPMIKQDNEHDDQGIFIADIHVSSQNKKIYYKFIVDGKWIYDETLPLEKDKDGNINNVIYTT